MFRGLICPFMADIFFISHTLKAYAHQARFVSFSGSKKGARFTGLSLLLSEISFAAP